MLMQGKLLHIASRARLTSASSHAADSEASQLGGVPNSAASRCLVLCTLMQLSADRTND